MIALCVFLQIEPSSLYPQYPSRTRHSEKTDIKRKGQRDTDKQTETERQTNRDRDIETETGT